MMQNERNSRERADERERATGRTKHAITGRNFRSVSLVLEIDR